MAKVWSDVRLPDPETPNSGFEIKPLAVHLDEVFVKINGERHYLWRAVDHEGEVLESYVTKKRDKKAALKFPRKAMRKHGQPEVIVTDKLRSYGAALKDLGAPDKQKTGRWVNNRAENSHSLPDNGLIQTMRRGRFDDESERCPGSAGCEVCRNLPLFMLPPRTTSTRNDISTPETTSSCTDPPLSLSGVPLVASKRQVYCPS